MVRSFTRDSRVLLFLLFNLLAPTAGRAAPEGQVAVVSAASFENRIAPDSLASLFGTNLTDNLYTAELNQNGQLPAELGGVSVTVANRPTALIFASPTQVNFWLPPGIAAGVAPVRLVNTRTGISREGTVTVAAVAPGLFTLDCIRATRGAVLNSVTYALEPFSAYTETNPISDKRTRLSLFATGVRNAEPQSVQVLLTDSVQRTRPLAVEYAGPAPGFFGLDQINVVLAPELDGIGLVSLSIQVGNALSNKVTVNLADPVQVSSSQRPYLIRSVAGTGVAGAEGEGVNAVTARLRNPAAVAFDRQGNVWIADAANHMVRRIDSSAAIQRVAGTGTAGYNGDGRAALEAQLNTPVSIATGPGGDVYVVDQGNQRIRRIDSQGRITTVAGTGDAGFSGDLGPAMSARLSNPTAVAVDQWSNLVIADTGNHRVRRVTSDGVIATVAGTGTAGFSGDGNSGSKANFDSPTSVAVATDGSVFIADGKNYRIRRLSPDGTVRTLVGMGVSGSESQACAALAAKLNFPLDIAVDPLGRILLVDSTGGRVSRLDTDCVLRPIAGTGNAGFSGDNGPALQSALNQPSGLAVSPTGEIYLADTNNHRLRQLYVPGDSSRCSDVFSVSALPGTATSGQIATVFVRLNCPSDSATTVSLSSSTPLSDMVSVLTIPAGQLSGAVSFKLPSVADPTVVTITANNGPSTQITTTPSGGPPVSVSFTPSMITGGEPVVGTIVLGTPAPAGGMTVTVASNNAAARTVDRVVVPEGQTGAQFVVTTTPVNATVPVTITASAGGASGQGSITLTGAEAGTGALTGISIAPTVVTGGQNAQVTVTLAEPAGPGGVTVGVSSSDPAAVVPNSITIPAGQTTGTATVTTTPVTGDRMATITASSANPVTATLQVKAGDSGPQGPVTGTISTFSLSPDTVIGGQQNPTGTVTLASPAAAGGVVVTLTSNNPAATVPASLTIPAGQSTGTFPVTTGSVSNTQTISVTATSANAMMATLTLNAPDSGNGNGNGNGDGPPTGTIGSVTFSPATVVGGQQNATGTVTLTSPAPAGGIPVSLVSNNPAATVPPSLTIPAGQTSGTFAITTRPVSTPQSAVVTASSGNSMSAPLALNPASPTTAAVSSVTLSPATVVGGQQNPTGTVSLESPAPAGGVSVTLTTNNPAATVPPRLIIPAGQTSGTFAVTTSPVSAPQTPTITATSANSTSTTLTLNPVASVASVSISPSAVTGGSGATGTVTLSAPAPAGGLTVPVSSNNPAATVSGSVSIPAGQTTGTFPISTTPVNTPVSANITAALGSTPRSATLTINPPCVSGLNLSVNSILGGNGLTGTVQLTGPAPAGGANVSLLSNNTAVQVPSSVLVPAGQTSAVFNVATSSVPTLLASTIRALLGTCSGIGVNLNVEAPVLSGLSVAPSSVRLLGNATGTVTSNGPAPAGGLVVNLNGSSSLGSLLLNLPASVTIPAGQNSATFNVRPTLSLGSLLTGLVNSTIAASSGGVTVNSPITVLP